MKPSHSPSESNSSQRLFSRLAITAALAGTAACAASPLREASSQTSSPAAVSPTRELIPPKSDHPESVETAMNGLAMKKYMDPKEVVLMQAMHEEIYDQYINPAFIMYLKKTGLSDKVYPALNLLVAHPEAFEYLDKGNGRVEIKRRNLTDDPIFVPDDFLVVIDGTNKEVTRVNGVDLAKPNGSISWMQNTEYSGRMKNYRDEFNSVHQRLLYGDRYKKWERNGKQPAEEWKTIFADSFKGIPEDLKVIHVVDNIDFPRRLVDLVEARHLSFELSSPDYQNLKAQQQVQGKSFREITSEGFGEYGKLHVSVFTDEQNPGVYALYTRSAIDAPVRVNTKGYMMVDAGGGKWVPDPRYNEALSRDYYARHPEAPKK
jgi:hypothetical protein